MGALSSYACVQDAVCRSLSKRLIHSSVLGPSVLLAPRFLGAERLAQPERTRRVGDRVARERWTAKVHRSRTQQTGVAAGCANDSDRSASPRCREGVTRGGSCSRHVPPRRRGRGRTWRWSQQRHSTAPGFGVSCSLTRHLSGETSTESFLETPPLSKPCLLTACADDDSGV